MPAGYYTEADAWQYAFAAAPGLPGMIQLYGGNQAFIARLDELFDQDSYMSDWRVDTTGLIGQYSHGNEPDEATPYLYALAGAQYKTAWIVREIQLTQYDNTPGRTWMATTIADKFPPGTSGARWDFIRPIQRTAFM